MPDPANPPTPAAGPELAELLIELGGEVGAPLTQALERLQELLGQQADGDITPLLGLREPLRRARDAALAASQIGRLASGRVRPALEHCALHQSLRQAVEMRRREAQSRGLQLRLDACDAGVVADPALLAGLLQALLDWALWHTRSSIELRISLSSWPALARLQCRFALRDLDQPLRQRPASLEGLRWRLVSQMAETMALKLHREDEAGVCVAELSFPLWREQLALELPAHAQPATGHDTQPFAGWLGVVVSADEAFHSEVGQQMQPQGWALESVRSIDAAFQICMEALPQAIVVDGRLAGADLDQWRCHILADAPGFCFIEVLPDERAQRQQRSIAGLRCSRSALSKELPTLLRAALVPPGEALTFRL